ncbi:hypothetical protein BKA70DRAFT_1100897 [Coprinopsis sp. MPI-PUGE-AT-0042]|nr:hypothetical protein BKA70DRAFT_1100897 [Coprinopsis sp. MPI-PUGE-AT-0042]
MAYLRDYRQRVASETSRILDTKQIHFPTTGCTYDLSASIQYAVEHTRCYFPSHPALSLGDRGQLSEPSRSPAHHGQRFHSEFQQMGLLQGANYLQSSLSLHIPSGPSRHSHRVGIVNFASATRLGEDWSKGAEGQEASIFRSSTLSKALESSRAKPFYDAHDKRKGNDTAGWYSDAMIFTPGVVVFRDDEGEWRVPFEVDVVTCAPVDAREIAYPFTSTPTSALSDLEMRMRDAMKARMARVLLLFRHRGVTNLVLGAPETGVSGNTLETILSIWAEVLLDNESLKRAFDRIVFAAPNATAIVLLQNLLRTREASTVRKLASRGSLRVRIADPKPEPKPVLKSILKKYPSKP